MAEGGASSIIDLIVDIDIENLGGLDKTKEKVKRTMKAVSKYSKKAGKHMGDFNSNVEENKESANALNTSFSRLTGAGLALLFAGRFLSKTFGGLAKSMLQMVGVSDMFSATLKTIMLPAVLAIQPIIMRVLTIFMNMGDTMKMVVGSFVLLMAVLAPIIMIFGQLLAGVAGVIGVLGAGALLSVLGAVALAIGLVVGAVLLFIASFKATKWALRNLIPVLRDFAKKAIDKIGDFVDFVLSGMKTIVNKIKTALGNAKDSAVDKIQDLIKSVASKLKSMGGTVKDAAVKVGEKIIEGIESAIKSGGGAILQGIANLIPGVGSDQISSLVNSAGGKLSNAISGVRANDFVMNDGKLIKTHPNDVLFGMKNPSELGGGGGGDVTINIDRPQLNNEMDVDKMIERIKRDLDRDTRGRSGLR